MALLRPMALFAGVLAPLMPEGASSFAQIARAPSHWHWGHRYRPALLPVARLRAEDALDDDFEKDQEQLQKEADAGARIERCLVERYDGRAQGAVSRESVLKAGAAFAISAFALPRSARALSNAEEFDDVNDFIRGRVNQANNFLIESNRRFNEKTYELGKRLQGRGDALDAAKPPPPLMELAFATTAAALPLQAFQSTARISAKEAASLVETAKNRYRPFFERRSDVGVLPTDLRNHTAFNFESYCQWKAFQPKLLTREARQRFLRELGDLGLEVFFLAQNAAVEEKLAIYDARTGGLAKLLLDLTEVLDYFRRVGYITGFAIQADSIDDTTFVAGGPAAFSIIVDQEAPLSAKILLDYEGSKGFLPDLLEATLARYMARCNLVAQYEQYYLDDRYRPDASKYSPTQTLVAWTLEEE